MKRTLLIRPEAERDMASARDWYERERSGLGDALLDSIAAALRDLEQTADHTELYYGNFRRVLVRRFPYKIFFQTFEDRVVVFRVLHARQDHPRKLE